MLFECFNKVLGGTWVMKERCRMSRSPAVRNIMLLIYTKALQAKGSWISVDAQFSSIPCFPHGIYGIFISGGVSVGRDCVIFQQVTIGSNTLIDSSRQGAPTIGDNCYIGAGAKIIGNVTVGSNVRVAANAAVVRDVPGNSIVFGGDQRVVTRDHILDNRFYQKYQGQWRYFHDGSWSLVSDAQELSRLEVRFPARR